MLYNSVLCIKKINLFYYGSATDVFLGNLGIFSQEQKQPPEVGVL